MKHAKPSSAEKAFSHVAEALEKKAGVFRLRGWVRRKRELSGKIFIVLRDVSGDMQCVVSEDATGYEDAKKLFIESSIVVEGVAKEDERAPGGVELVVSRLEPISVGQEYPIQRDLSEDFLLDVRHLWVRSSRMADALKLKASVFKAFRDYMEKNDYIEITNPTFVSGAVEGGSTLFEVPYFGKTVYLTQSGQFYNEAYVFALEKIYTVQPSFRAEKSRTRRHVTEFAHAEMEAAYMELPGLLDFCEDMLVEMVQQVRGERAAELKRLGRDPNDLKKVDKPFERFKYREILEEAKKRFDYLEWGSDLGEKEEREVTKDFVKPIMVTHYPAKLKPFYHRPSPENPEEVLCCDVLAPEGYGEIIGSGERCWQLDELEARMKAENISPEAYEWYLDLRRYGAVPHSGFGLGLERMSAWLGKLEHIRDVIGFPRTMNRFYP